MYKHFLWVLLLISGLALAELPPLTQDPAAGGVISNAPPATQLYQSVDDPVPAPVPAVVAPVKKVIQKKTLSSSSSSSQQTANLATEVQTVQANLSQFTQSYLLAQQESKQELALLEQKTVALQAEIEQLLMVLKTLSQQVDQVKGQMSSNQQQLSQLSHRSFVQNLLGDSNAFLQNYNNILLILLVLILLMSWWLVRRLKKQRALLKAARTTHEEDDTKSEYDFMGSSEGIPAQLDLVRAYMAMENYGAARGVLEQVLAKGDAVQQQQARDLLAKIKS